MFKGNYGYTFIFPMHPENFLIGESNGEKTVGRYAKVSEIAEICGACREKWQDRNWAHQTIHNLFDPSKVLSIIARRHWITFA